MPGWSGNRTRVGGVTSGRANHSNHYTTAPLVVTIDLGTGPGSGAVAV